MALISNSERYCTMTHHENGTRGTTRRVFTIMVQAADGKVHQLEGERLPDSITIYTSNPNHRGSADILLGSPPRPSVRAFATSFLNGTRARDLTFTLLGMFVITVLATVADVIAQMLNR